MLSAAPGKDSSTSSIASSHAGDGARHRGWAQWQHHALLWRWGAIDHDEPEERALALSLSRSAARLGTNRHAPEGTDLEHDHDASWKRKARVAGFDLEATTEVRPDDRQRLAHLCCYLLRPPLAERRLRFLPGGEGPVALELKSPWRDGTTWLSMSAHTFLERLCSLVPRPRTNQILYRGVLAANSARRKKVVPEPDDYARPKNATFCELMRSL